MGFRLRDIMPRGLYPRSILIAIVPVILLLAAVTYVFYDSHWRQTSRKLSQGVASEIAFVLELRRDTAVADGVLQDLALTTLKLDFEFDAGGQLPPVQRRSFFTPLDDTLRQELSVRLDQPFWYDISGFDDQIEIRVMVEDGVLIFAADRDRTFSTTGHIFIFWVIGATIILIFLALGFLRNQMRSILQLAAAAKAFGRGREAPGFRPSGATEIREAARAVLDMKAKLTAAAEQRTAMLAGVSHDLRTPLTRLKLQFAMMDEDDDVRAARRDLNDMEAMLDEYLAFARGEEAENPETVNLGALTAEVAEVAEPVEPARLRVVAKPDVRIEGRPLALKRAMTNLVTNALSHADHVELTLVDGPRAADFIVDDDGPGIPPGRYEEAFRPFSRLDTARGQNRSGAGLGLALSRDTARGHGGDITLEESPLGGLRARLRLPR
ncbi:MAG: ATP-binding protein [Pseudomonadota bacterium]